MHFPVRAIPLALSAALGLFACTSAPEAPQRDPSAADWNVGRLLATCRHAPLRYFGDRIALVPKKTTSWKKNEYFQAVRDCSRADCNGIRKMHLDSRLDGSHFVFDRGRIPEEARHALYANAIGVLPPTGKDVTVEAGESIGVVGTRYPAFFSDEPRLGPTEGSSRFSFVVLNPDLSFGDAVSALSPFFDLRVDSAECPLPKNEQGNRCHQRRLPYDPTEEKLIENYAAYQKTKDYWASSPGDKIEVVINSRGYSYLVEYEDDLGRMIPGSDETRYTANSYVVLDAITRVPCLGWKIRRVAINAHNGINPYGHYLDRINGTGDFYERSTAKFDAGAVRYRARDALRHYVRGAVVTLNLCYSYQPKAGPSGTIGNALASVPPYLNPIRTIHGVAGECITLSADADSGLYRIWPLYHIPNFIQSDEPTRWDNPRFESAD